MQILPNCPVMVVTEILSGRVVFDYVYYLENVESGMNRNDVAVEVLGNIIVGGLEKYSFLST